MTNEPPAPGAEPLFAGVQREAARLSGDMRWALAKRWELARLELAIAGLQVRRLTLWLLGALLALVTVLPVVVVLVADWLGEVTVWPRAVWLLLFAIALLVGAPLAAWLAWRKFRRDFVGLEATLDELREDLRWLEEYLPRHNEGASGERS